MLCTTPFKIDKIYIITYDDNLDKVYRVFNQLVKIWLDDIYIVKWINKKDLDIHDYWQNWTKVVYPYNNELRTVWLKPGMFITNNCACMLSHKIAFEIAKERWHENIMVVEDDLMMWYKVERYLNIILENVPNDWDMLRLERKLAREMWEVKLINNYRFVANNVWSTAWMLFNKKAINYILDVMNDKPIGSFDQLTNKQCKDLKSYTSLWSMWIQYPLN